MKECSGLHAVLPSSEQYRKEQHKQRRLPRTGEPSRADHFKAPGSSDRHHLDTVARMKERSGLHAVLPSSEQHRKEQHKQRVMPQKTMGGDQKTKLTSPPPSSVKVQSHMFDQLEREIQRQQQNRQKSHGGPTQPGAQVPDSFRSQHEQKPRSTSKEREGVFSLELQKQIGTRSSGPEHKRLLGEKPGEIQKGAHDLPLLNVSPAKSRARTTSSSSDVSPTVAKMRKDDRRLSQDPNVNINPQPSEVDVKCPPVPVRPDGDILAFCEQAVAGEISPVQQSPIKPGPHSIKMKLGLKTPTKSEKIDNNNGEIAAENMSDRGSRVAKGDERPVHKEYESKEPEASSSNKKDKSFERHERKSRDHKTVEKQERSDLKLKISLGGHGGSNVKTVKNDEAKKHTTSPQSLTTSDGLKLKIKLNSSEQSSSGGCGSDKEKQETRAQNQEQKSLKMVLKLPTGISSTPPPSDEKERHHRGHHHKKHKHKDRHKEDRHSRKRAHSPGNHESGSRHSSSHQPPSSKVPRSDMLHINNTNPHGNERHSEGGGGGSSRNSPALQKVNQSVALLQMVIKKKSMDLEREKKKKEYLSSGPPLPADDAFYPAPPLPPPSDAPPLPPGPPPTQ